MYFFSNEIPAPYGPEVESTIRFSFFSELKLLNILK